MNKIISGSSFLLLNVDYVKLNKKWNYRNVISPFYRIYYIDGGAGMLRRADQEVLLEEGYLYLIPSFTFCDYSARDYLGQYYVHILEESVDGTSLFASNRKIFKMKATRRDIDNFGRILELNPGRDLRRSDNPGDYDKQPVLDSFKQLNDRVPPDRYLETSGIILQLLSRFLAADHFRQEDVRVVPARIADAINYIQTNLHENLTVDLLAERAGQNPDYFSRVFNNHTGSRPLAYIQRKRIERAQFMIITTDLSFTMIAVETGFDSLSYFSRIFKNITGQTPRDYRKRNGGV
ncbi:HTH-type transcriptional activator RhaS [Dyadobacter sp. CECT 9275]|uniref:HTH-type transcriptional activator RhaS n=1 Tax=Dyadobacter helix TaxID=2822344 RepID=A0A916NP13_9BACT|nr:AraC family transcriptional regulator [Dyadobacter sp. CECT 9275]CAG5018119.1 HTH-type transcriptional activator RhaS [Dyadobacter sp. CECT 9275]